MQAFTILRCSAHFCGQGRLKRSARMKMFFWGVRWRPAGIDGAALQGRYAMRYSGAWYGGQKKPGRAQSVDRARPKQKYVIRTNVTPLIHLFVPVSGPLARTA